VKHWLLTAGDFRRQGGMDAANHALAAFLASQADAEVHLVAHTVSSDLATAPAVRIHRVLRPFDSHRLGQSFLRSAAQRLQRRLGSVRSIANGGNADLADVNWVHYVHAAYAPRSTRRGAIDAFTHHHNLRHETASLDRARTVICNSHRTAADIVRLNGVSPDLTQVVYYGIDPIRFGPIEPDERERARGRLSLPDGRLVALFVGALGDRRKNFDTLFDAWRTLCASTDWDVDLIVAGSGAELPAWKARAASQLGRGRIEFLGYHDDVASLLAASDILIHPARYEPYGLAVHEALSRGIPAFVGSDAGVAERYPDGLRPLLLTDPESAGGLCSALRRWRSDPLELRRRTAIFAESLRARTWDDMAGEIVSAIEGRAA
jgi:glycosyltransferase involved in cell wall biosynthesis